MPPARPLPPCPSCGSLDAIPIAYGYPLPETFEAAARGEVALGGCIIGDESPDYECRACGYVLAWVNRHGGSEGAALIGGR